MIIYGRDAETPIEKQQTLPPWSEAVLRACAGRDVLKALEPLRAEMTAEERSTYEQAAAELNRLIELLGVHPL